MTRILFRRARRCHERKLAKAVDQIAASAPDGADIAAGATTLFDAYAPAHFQIGLVLRRLGEPDAARAAFARAAQLNPGLIPPDELR